MENEIKDAEIVEDPQITTEEIEDTKEGPLKSIFVDYVGTKLKLEPGKDNVTLDMLVTILAEEFPDFVMAIAEENWIRGYKQALQDLDSYRTAQMEKAKADADKRESSSDDK